jgi:hypothetical protein
MTNGVSMNKVIKTIEKVVEGISIISSRESSDVSLFKPTSNGSAYYTKMDPAFYLQTNN